VSRGQPALFQRVLCALVQRRARQAWQQARMANADATWRALQAVNRINRAHWQAQQAMCTEAARWEHQDDGWS
jgi:hypothetical protein